MCYYQELCHNDSIGYVIRCNECEKIQVAWNNLVMTFAQEDFVQFYYWVKKIRDEQPAHQNPKLRNIMLPAPCRGIQLLLCIAELEEFASLLEHADSELQSLHMIGLFNQ
jgi:hypothetical protein